MKSVAEMTNQELSVEPRTILKYLLDRSDFNVRRRIQVGFVFKFLGFVALYSHKDLLHEYQESFPDPLNPLEYLGTCRKLFSVALERNSLEPDFPAASKKPRPLRPEVCKDCLRTALMDGKEMLASGQNQFLSIFLMLCLLGLELDKGAKEDFEDNCIGADKTATQIISSALDIVRKALTLIDDLIQEENYDYFTSQGIDESRI